MNSSNARWRTPLLIGSVSAFLSVGLGAFAAHSLKTILSSSQIETFETGVEYQFLHSLALILIAILLRLSPNSKSLLWGWRLISLGILLFSGSLYLLVFTTITSIGFITPIGGVCFLAGWSAIVVHALTSKEQ